LLLAEQPEIATILYPRNDRTNTNQSSCEYLPLRIGGSFSLHRRRQALDSEKVRQQCRRAAQLGLDQLSALAMAGDDWRYHGRDYRGDFVETVLKNIRAFMSPRGVAIVDVPMRCRAFIAQQIKRRRTGPERTFSPRETRVLLRNSGYACLEAVYQYREMSPSMHHFLAIRRMDGWIPWPSTWMYLVLRRTDH